MTAKICRSGNKMRTEMPQRGTEAYFLLLLKRHTGYMVAAPGLCMAVHQFPLRNSNPLWLTGMVRRKELGSETVNGHSATIEELTILPAKGGKPQTIKAWEATDRKGFPVRDGHTAGRRADGVHRHQPVFTTRISVCDAEFATPKGCSQMPDMPGMQAMGQQAGKK